jgi:hypothetical protein
MTRITAYQDIQNRLKEAQIRICSLEKTIAYIKTWCESTANETPGAAYIAIMCDRDLKDKAVENYAAM